MSIISISSQEILELIEASLNANYTDVRQISSRIAASSTSEHPEISKKIKQAIRRKGVPLRASGYSESLPTDPKSRSALVEEHPCPISPVFLNESLKKTFDTFISSVKNYELLQENGLSGKMNLLMSGPPGTGKTLVAGHIASALSMPLYVVRLDSLISSLLGDTAKNIRSVFDFVPTKNGIIFLDEFDAIGKLRNDNHELGELKRVVNTLIQAIDSLDDKAIVIAATNHPELLDRAIWRRFPYRMRFETPDFDLRTHLWNHFLFQDKGESTTLSALGKISSSMSGADIESVALSARRAAVIEQRQIDVPELAAEILMAEHSEFNNDKKRLCRFLSKNLSMTQIEILTIVKISRQTLSTYLKD
ncbi:ATPase family associated with various cellular activities (AAA) [Pseudomonas sp. BS3767]|nr:ATPase family associated with various cellular activities (AAA) [Pseudomonas sp. BS3767]SDO19866.1 ATPase family associated with various cellular activities (AAA) [Pseudomonas sp. BS3759]